MVTEGDLTAKMVDGRLKSTDPVKDALFRNHKTVKLDTSLGELSRIFDRHHFALVFTEQRTYSAAGTSTSPRAAGGGTPTSTGEAGGFRVRKMIFGVVTRIDLLRYITAERK